MAFVRVKKVKQWKYAYLVENKWKSKKTKQKVKQYLGRVHCLENIAGAEFGKDVESLSFRDAVCELVKFELMKNGFKEGKEGLKKESLLVNLDKCKFLDGKKPVAFESNEGFICSFTFKNAVNFKKSQNEEDTGLRLAETLLEAGISMPHNVFVKLFEKIHKIDVPIVEDTQKFINKV